MLNTVLISTELLALCYWHCAIGIVLLDQCYQHSAKSTVFQLVYAYAANKLAQPIRRKNTDESAASAHFSVSVVVVVGGWGGEVKITQGCECSKNEIPEFQSFHPLSPLLVILFYASNHPKTFMKFYLTFDYSQENSFPIYLLFNKMINSSAIQRTSMPIREG